MSKPDKHIGIATSSNDPDSCGEMTPELLAKEFNLSTHFTKRMLEELEQRPVVSECDEVTDGIRGFLAECSSLFQGISTKGLGIYFLGEESSSRVDFLSKAKSHFAKMADVLEGDTDKFLRREIFYKAPIPNTPYYLLIRRGFLENNWGMEFAIGTEDVDWQRSEKIEDHKDLARIGINFDDESVRIVNVEGVEHAKKLINKHMPKNLKHKPLNLLILLVSMWATEQGFKKVKGIKNSHQKYLEDRRTATGEILPYNAIFKAVGLTDRGGSWMELDTEDFYQKALGQLSPAQYDGFDNVATAFGDLVPLDRQGQKTYSDYPFYLKDDLESIMPLLTTVRYEIHKQLPWLGAINSKANSITD